MAKPAAKVKKKIKRVVTDGIAHVHASFNNSIVTITGLNKWYGDFHVLRDINLDVAKGERIVICGPSGSGKSTLIRCINALEEFQEGQIVVDSIELGPNLRRVDEVRREVGMSIKRLMDLGCYRGQRHRRGLPLRGQRTRTNARTRKGPRKAIKK